MYGRALDSYVDKTGVVGQLFLQTGTSNRENHLASGARVVLELGIQKVSWVHL